MTDAEQAIQRVLGSTIERRTPAPWGSKNRTTIIDLVDGRRVVAQFYSDSTAATVRLRAAEQLAQPLIEHRVPVPRVLARDLDGAVPWAVFEMLPGEPGYVAAGHDLSAQHFPAIAADMGRIARRIRELDPDDFRLPRLWTDAPAVAAAADRWLSGLEIYLPSADLTAARRILDSVPALFADRPSVVCHGDFGPQNVLVLDERVSGVLDLEDARIADPLLDIAWWAWLVRAHTPRAFTKSWPAFLQAADVSQGQDSFEEVLLALIVLRLLETAEAFRRSAPAKYPSWAERLSKTLTWASRPID